MTTTQLRKKYDDESFFTLRNIIVADNEESEEAAFYLLRYRMEREMKAIYRSFELKDELGDVLMDFQLYLRNGKAGNNKKAYQGIEGLRSILMFKGWMKRVFRNFLVDRAAKESQERVLQKELRWEDAEQGYNVDERRIKKVCVLIAWMLQESSPNETFIFLRHLLVTMCKMDIIPSEKMSEALGITYGNYRTRDSRINTKMQERLTLLNSGKKNVLYPDFGEKAKKMFEHFDNLASLIKSYYEENLDRMEKEAKAKVQAVREKDLEERKKEVEKEKLCTPIATDNARFSLSVANDCSIPEIRFSKRMNSEEDNLEDKIEVRFSKREIPVEPKVKYITLEDDSVDLDIIHKDFSDLCPRKLALRRFCEAYL